MHNLSNIKQYIFSRSISSAYFWGAISIPYLTFRQFSIQGAYGIIGLYSLLVVLFEYPTGVVGDTYGHKASINLGNLLGFTGMVLMAQSGKYSPYIAISVMALAASLVSGSDIALLKHISNNFKKDLSNLKALQGITLFLAMTIAGFLASINILIPVYATGFSWLISYLLMSPVVDPSPRSDRDRGNIYQTSLESLRAVKNSIPLAAIIVFGGIAGGYMGSVKTLINSLGPLISLDLKLVGVFVGLSMLSRTVGYKIANQISHIRTRYIIAISVIVLILGSAISHQLTVVSLIAGNNLFLSIINFRITIEINDLIPNTIRASILSFKNLVTRLFSSLYLFGSGYILGIIGLDALLLVTALIIAIGSLGYLIVTNKQLPTN